SVDGSAEAARPTGSLTFSEGSTTLGRATLRAVEGSTTTAVATWSGVLAPGGHNVVVAYGGNARLAPAVSPPVGVSVINSTISMTVDPDPIVSGQPFTATVTVGAAPGGVPGTPSGTVTVPANGGGTPVALDAAGTARIELTAPMVTEPTQVSYLVSYSGDGTFDQRYAQVMVNAVPG
nr:Ig-like domain repeat protein [Micromonospora sp. DSM 115978]